MKKFLSGAVGMLFSGILMISGSFNARALDNGVYTAASTPYYVHPVTGEVEDRGGIDSVGIGQPMTDSATHTEALIEVDPDGNTFATVRIKLMDSIEDVSFMVQADGNSPFYDVDFDVMQENLDDNTTDFRMQIPSENSYLRATFYVVPMGRYVIYYIGFSDFREGSSDFITSVDLSEPTEASPEDTTEEMAETTSESATSTTVTTSTVTAATTTAAITYVENEDDPMPAPGSSSDNDGLGVLIYDERGNKMNLSDIVDGSAEGAGKDSGNNSMVIGVLVGCGGTVAVIGIAYAIIRAKRKKGSK